MCVEEIIVYSIYSLYEWTMQPKCPAMEILRLKNFHLIEPGLEFLPIVVTVILIVQCHESMNYCGEVLTI